MGEVQNHLVLRNLRSAGELADLSLALSSIEDWLRESCEARHADRMADRIHEAWLLIDDLCDEMREKEEGDGSA